MLNRADRSGSRRNVWLRAAGVTLAATAVLATAAPASATAEPKVDEERLAERLELACSRVDLATDRVGDRLERLTGDADTIGSVAWLESRLDQARENDREQLVERLELRLDVRRELTDVLRARSDALAEAAEFCATESAA